MMQLSRKGAFYLPSCVKRAPLKSRYNCIVARGICTFRQRDVTAAVKAVVAAGVAVARIEIDRGGKIVIIVGKGGESGNPNGHGNDAANEWDEVFDGADKAPIRQ